MKIILLVFVLVAYKVGYDKGKKSLMEEANFKIVNALKLERNEPH